MSRHFYYIQTNTNIGILGSISLAMKRSGTKFRYERADLALWCAPVRYDKLRLHLAELILVRPYRVLLNSLGIAVINHCIPPSIAVLIRKWLHDPSRLHGQLVDLIQTAVIRRNRIQFARSPWRTAKPKRPRPHVSSIMQRMDNTQTRTSVHSSASTPANITTSPQLSTETHSVVMGRHSIQATCFRQSGTLP